MSDDPLKLKKILLEKADTDEQKQFAKMLAEQCVIAEKERLTFYVPSPEVYEKMKPFANGVDCPSCKKGRIVCEIYQGNIGDTFWLKCKYGDKDCKFEPIGICDEDF